MELYLLVCLLLLRVSVIHGIGSIQDVTDKLNDMNIFLHEVKSEMSDVRGGVEILKERFDTDLKLAKIDLKHYVTNTIVPTFVRSQVEHALEDILRTRTLDSLINRQVMNSLQRLKNAHRVLKNSLRFYVERYSETENENRKIKSELAKVKHVLVDIRHEFQSSKILNLTLKLNETRTMCSLEKQPDSDTTTVRNTSMSDSDTTTVRNTSMSELVSTVVPSVSQPQYNMSRVLYVSSNYQSVPKQLLLKTSESQTFPLHLSNVHFHGFVFEPTSRKIIFCVSDENYRNYKMYSSDQEGGAVKVIKYGLESSGLAVDTTRNVIFMTTRTPTVTISRMRPDGSEFRVLVDVRQYGLPYNIAVVPDKQLIYSAHEYAVIETSYDGGVRRTIKTGSWGSYMYALDYDNIAHKLYYNIGQTLMRWSPGNKESTTIYTLTNIPTSLQFYRNSLYIGYFDSKELGVVDLNKDEAVYRKLSEGEAADVVLCLLP